METTDLNFSPQQSLQLIESMIAKTKANISDNRFYFLLWGWLTFTAIMFQYVFKVFVAYKHHYILTLVLPLVGMMISILYSRKNKRRIVRTYIGDSMRYLWTGLGISFFIISLLFSQIEGGWLFCYPFYILLYGLGTFVSGKIIQFKPLVVGGIFNWVLAAAAVFFDFDSQMLFAAAAILTSYIIPGHLLKPQKS